MKLFTLFLSEYLVHAFDSFLYSTVKCHFKLCTGLFVVGFKVCKEIVYYFLFKIRS